MFASNLEEGQKQPIEAKEVSVEDLPKKSPKWMASKTMALDRSSEAVRRRKIALYVFLGVCLIVIIGVLGASFGKVASTEYGSGEFKLYFLHYFMLHYVTLYCIINIALTLICILFFFDTLMNKTHGLRI